MSSDTTEFYVRLFFWLSLAGNVVSFIACLWHLRRYRRSNARAPILEMIAILSGSLLLYHPLRIISYLLIAWLNEFWQSFLFGAIGALIRFSELWVPLISIIVYKSWNPKTIN